MGLIKNTTLKIVLSLMIVSLLSCDTQNSLDCTQTSGTIIVEDVTLPDFTKVVVYQRTRLIIKQGAVQQVRVETGRNLMNEIKLTVVDGRLLIKNENGCNLLRDYGITTVYITAPNLTEVRTSTGLDIQSDGILSYQNLTLLSEDTAVEDAYNTDGDFRLDLNVENLKITSTNLSNF